MMDERKIPYSVKVISPILFELTKQNYDNLAWEVIRRAVAQCFDLKTLPISQKQILKLKGLMHPVENGVIKW